MAGDQGGGGGVSRISLIAAVGRNGAIGTGGGMPWRLSSDLKHFKALTWAKPLIMGRKTFDSVGRPLPGRDVIVVTRDAGWSRADVRVARSLDEALRLAAGAGEVMIGGGGEIYRLALPLARRLYITEVDLAPEADVRFPEIDPADWRETRREVRAADVNDDAGFAFVQYERS